MIVLGVMLVIYLIAMVAFVQTKKDNSLGNFTWGGMVMIVTLYTFFTTPYSGSRQSIATAMIMLWGIRLIIYIYMRYKKGADPRFVAWQNQWGKYALVISIGWIVLANGFMGIIMSLPSALINKSVLGNLTFLDYIAICFWTIGFIIESVSDYQLYSFNKQQHHFPFMKEKILDTGLWRYSRHPNYFGEIVMWWALYLLALSVPHGWLTIVSPLAVTTTLLFVTGIPLLEKSMAGNSAYQEYKKRTSILIPMRPKK